MNSGILIIMKKEFARFFGDKRMLLLTLLPGIMIYVVYSFMGSAISGMLSPDEDYTPAAFIAYMPDSLRPAFRELGFEINEISPDEADGIKEQIALKEAQLCVIFPAGFDDAVAEYNVLLHSSPAPNIEIYYNSVDNNSAAAYRSLTGILELYESGLSNKFDINREIPDSNLATEKDTSASFISAMMPMLLMIFLYSGCVGIAPESIAGEKERGTIATLLVTPLHRSQLAIGKILSLGVLAFLSGLVSAVATILSLPKLIQGAGDFLSVSIYSPMDYFWLACVILSTILLLISVISIISAFAKTVKEAGAAVVPIMVIVMLVGVTGMLSDGGQTAPYFYIIPVYSSVQSMSGVFSLEYSAVNIALSCFSNLVYACAGGFALTRMFNSEKVMFSS